MSGYHVIPLLLLRLGVGPWSDYHGGGCHVRAVHILDCLVCRCLAQPPRPGTALIFILGSSVSVTPKFETFVMSVKCSTLDGRGPGTLPQPCFCSTTLSSR